MQKFATPLLLGVLVISFVAVWAADNEEEAPDTLLNAEEDVPEGEVDEEKLDYARGSVCGYCTYCKFCKLCEKDCPCETSQTKPNCKMCKYCKYCHLCSAFCDTVCTPGGILDRVSGAIVNALPTFDKAEVDGDIKSVKHWIDKTKDEL